MLQKEKSEFSRYRAGFSDKSKLQAPVMVCAQQSECLTDRERELCTTIDAKLEACEVEDKVPGLIRVCRTHDLDDFEKHALLLSLVPCLGEDAVGKHFGNLQSAYACRLMAETIFDFMELNYEQRIRSLLKLLPEAPLIREGLIQLSYEPSTPGGLLVADIELTGKGMAALTCISGFEALTEPKDNE